MHSCGTVDWKTSLSRHWPYPYHSADTHSAAAAAAYDDDDDDDPCCINTVVVVCVINTSAVTYQWHVKNLTAVTAWSHIPEYLQNALQSPSDNFQGLCGPRTRTCKLVLEDPQGLVNWSLRILKDFVEDPQGQGLVNWSLRILKDFVEDPQGQGLSSRTTTLWNILCK